LYPIDNEKNTNIIVEIDAKTFGKYEWDIITKLSEIIKDSGEVGKFEIGNLSIIIVELNELQLNLIKCKNNVFNQ
jgi:hypothetical protein